MAPSGAATSEAARPEPPEFGTGVPDVRGAASKSPTAADFRSRGLSEPAYAKDVQPSPERAQGIASGSVRTCSQGIFAMTTRTSEFDPVFVHASARSGSTYVFGVLRRYQTLMCFNEAI